MSRRHAIDDALESALKHLEDAGIDRSMVILGIVGEHDDAKRSTPYATHVGHQTELDPAAMLVSVIKDLERETRDQAQAACNDTTCPKCGSPRVAMRHRRLSGNRLPMRDECMDCNYKGPDR